MWKTGLLLICCCVCGPELSAQEKNRPNIIYIMTDDMGYADLSCYGRKDYKTPNIDGLAAEGIRFTNAYSAGPLCTPTRVGFLTGRYPARHSLGLIEPLEWSAKDSLIGLSAEQPSIASLLKASGYHTALIGKWHLGFVPKFNPLQNGFEEFFGFHGGGVDYISHNGPRGQPDLWENEKPVKIEGYLTDLLTQKAITFLQRKHDKPFFLSLQYNAPHWPWQAPGSLPYPDTMRMMVGGSPVIYAAMMKSLDDNVGLLLKELKKAGLEKNTVVIFVNDNGGERYSDMGGLTGAKPQLWEGGVRVPAMVRWLGHIKPNVVSSQPIITMDWTVTILALAGARQATDFPMDGENLLPFLTGKTKPFPRSFYWRVFQRNQQKALRNGDWKYLKDEKDEYLFDLQNDPTEKVNLREKQPERFSALKAQYSRWEETVLKPVPLSRQ